MKPKDVVAWTLSVAFALLVAIVGIALAHDVWIGDFPALRALFSIDRELLRAAAVICIAALPATFLVFLTAGTRGNIKFSVLGIKVEGVAAAPVLWTLVFLCTAAVLTIALRMTGQW